MSAYTDDYVAELHRQIENMRATVHEAASLRADNVEGARLLALAGGALERVTAEAASLRDRVDELRTELESHVNADAAWKLQVGDLRARLATAESASLRERAERAEAALGLLQDVREGEVKRVLAALADAAALRERLAKLHVPSEVRKRLGRLVYGSLDIDCGINGCHNTLYGLTGKLEGLVADLRARLATAESASLRERAERAEAALGLLQDVREGEVKRVLAALADAAALRERLAKLHVPSEVRKRLGRLVYGSLDIDCGINGCHNTLYGLTGKLEGLVADLRTRLATAESHASVARTALDRESIALNEALKRAISAEAERDELRGLAAGLKQGLDDLAALCKAVVTDAAENIGVAKHASTAQAVNAVNQWLRDHDYWREPAAIPEGTPTAVGGRVGTLSIEYGDGRVESTGLYPSAPEGTPGEGKGRL